MDKGYKAIFWQSNPKLMYLGMLDQAWTTVMFDAQATYARDVLLGKITLPSPGERQKDIDAWIARHNALKDVAAVITF